MRKSQENPDWKDFDGDPDSPLQERSFYEEGMEHIDPKDVVLWDKKSGAALVAMNEQSKRISWDPSVIDSEAMKSAMRKAMEDVRRDERRKTKGFGY